MTTARHSKVFAWHGNSKNRHERPTFMTLVVLFGDFSVVLWYSLLPIFDDVTDVMPLLAMFEGRGGLWWACFRAFVLPDFDRVLLFLVTLLPVFWFLFALLATNECRGKQGAVESFERLV